MLPVSKSNPKGTKGKKKMKELKELKEKIENIKIGYDYEENYRELYNTITDYMNDTQDFDLEYLFEDFIDYETAEEIAKKRTRKGWINKIILFFGRCELKQRNIQN